MRRGIWAVVCVLVAVAAAGCADQDFTRDVEARWCELAGADCAPPPPLKPPALNQPEGGFVPAGPVYEIPPVYTAPSGATQ